MRAAAKITPCVAVRVDRDDIILRKIADDLCFVGFADVREMRGGFVAIPDLALDRQIGVHDLLHARFDLGEILRRERRHAREVVIEAVFDHRADRDLRAGEELLHCLRQHVRRIVAQHF